MAALNGVRYELLEASVAVQVEEVMVSKEIYTNFYVLCSILRQLHLFVVAE